MDIRGKLSSTSMKTEILNCFSWVLGGRLQATSIKPRRASCSVVSAVAFYYRICLQPVNVHWKECCDLPALWLYSRWQGGQRDWLGSCNNSSDTRLWPQKKKKCRSSKDGGSTTICSSLGLALLPTGHCTPVFRFQGSSQSPSVCGSQVLPGLWRPQHLYSTVAPPKVHAMIMKTHSSLK